MAEDFVLRAPSVLATLPKPVDSEHGRTTAATVYTQWGTRLTKRPEIALAIDGEGVSIYSVSRRLPALDWLQWQITNLLLSDQDREHHHVLRRSFTASLPLFTLLDLPPT